MTVTERRYVLPAMGELRVTGRDEAHERGRLLHLQPQAEEGAEQPRADVFGTELLPGVAVHLPAGRLLWHFFTYWVLIGGCGAPLRSPGVLRHRPLTRQTPALSLTLTLTWRFCVSGRDGVVRTQWGPVSCLLLTVGWLELVIRPDANELRCSSWLSSASS
ncbi:hypothetical protein C3747_121g3 [Trypanosoma cruzi]|uniref:Uncharacterized protein n=1 Tax=Trypanosoma cruzi TaxID=5693 RepID=A0A2V2WED0_TRYCR|nr:hypothetical protein C3747_121g3 [Trypanosoma cruzi]